jgi:hypothetical protein
MTFESVYRVSARNSLPSVADVEAVGRELAMDLPVGYREFVTSFGRGTLCDFLVVNMPNEIRDPHRPGELDRERLAYVAKRYKEEKRECVLTPKDIEEAVVFARAAAESPIWIACRRLGPRLFEQVEDWVVEVPEGIVGLVGRCTSGQGHEFPFFEPRNGRRRMRIFAVRTGVGRDGLVDSMARRWGHEGLRCSRTASDELYPHYFVPAIEGQVELLLDARHNRLPADSFYVRARYDIDSDPDVAAFSESLLLPGGSPGGYVGEAW